MRQVLLLSALAFATPAIAQVGGFQEVARLTAPDGAPDDLFGDAVAVSADTIAIGSPWHDAAGPNAGAVYVFERDLGGSGAWGLAEKLLSPWQDPEGDWFGQAVALDGDTLAVGAPWLDYSGGVLVYERGPGGFGLVAVNHAELEEALGWSLALEGDTLVAGAPDSCSPKWGCIPDEKTFVYGRNEGGAGAWGELQVLSLGGSCDGLGEDVELDGEVLIVGAPVLDYYCGNLPGAAHVYARPDSAGAVFSWSAKLAPGPDQEATTFGKQVAIDRPWAAFSGYREGAGFELEGEVDLWKQSSPGGAWQAAARIRGPIEPGLPTFGNSLVLRGNQLLVGQPAAGVFPAVPGRVWVYRRVLSGTWSFQGHLVPSDSQPDDGFGQSMDLSGSLLVVGAPSSSPNGSGAAYVFALGASELEEQSAPVGVGPGGW
jgi:hypothetical protein